MAPDFVEKPFDFTRDSLTLSGTLTLPRNKKHPPVILLLPGSGPVDRNENVEGFIQKIVSNNFQTLAHFLATQGFASYRYDKRSTNKKLRGSGFNALLNDAKQAITALKGCNEVNAKQLYVLGHSEGGYLGNIIASKLDEIKGFIVLASSVTPLDEAVIKQLDHISNISPKNKKTEQFNQLFSNLFRIMRTHDSWADIDENMLKTELKQISKVISILPAKTVKNMIRKQMQPEWFMESYEYDFKEHAKKITCPVLIIAGEKDYQVPASDAKQMADVISESGNEKVSFTSLPNLNHMLRYNEGEITPKAQLKSLKMNDFDKRVLDIIQTWLKEIAHPVTAGK